MNSSLSNSFFTCFSSLLLGAVGLVCLIAWIVDTKAPWSVWLSLAMILLTAGLIGAFVYAIQTKPEPPEVASPSVPSSEITVVVVGTYVNDKGAAETSVRLESGHVLPFKGYYGPPGTFVKCWQRGGDFFRTDPNIAGGVK